MKMLRLVIALAILGAPAVGLAAGGRPFDNTMSSVSPGMANGPGRGEQGFMSGRDYRTMERTKAALFADSRTHAADVHVSVKSGIVTLRGVAPSEAAKLAVAHDARTTDGVKAVVDDLAVVHRGNQ